MGILSMVHCVFASVASIWMIFLIEPADDWVSSQIPETPVFVSGGVFMGFLMFDLVHMGLYRHYFQFALLPAAAHHVLFLVMALVCGGTTSLVFVFPFIYLGEVSTIFLN